MGYEAPIITKLGIIEEDLREEGILKETILDNTLLHQAVNDHRIIQDKKVGRDDVGIYYLRGFTGGEVLKGYTGSLSRQGLYNKAEKINPKYLDAHREMRESIEKEVNNYLFYDKPNLTGTMEHVRQAYKGRGYIKIYDEYLHNGGIAPKYDKQLESNSKYLQHYSSLAKGERIEGIDEKQYKSMLAGFYRFRKTEVDKAVILGDLSLVNWLHPRPEYVEKRTQAVIGRIKSIMRKFSREQSENPTQAILTVYIEHEMEVYGEEAREFYQTVIES